MKAIRVSPCVRVQKGLTVEERVASWSMIVKETNPYFEWYKKSRAWKVREEFEI